MAVEKHKKRFMHVEVRKKNNANSIKHRSYSVTLTGV